MIEVQHLTKRYRDLVAVDKISFTIEKGQILGFLGPNGAGKTTTMRMVTGYLSPTSGHVRIDKQDIFDNPLDVKGKIGYLPETPPLYLDMTARHYLGHVADIKGIAYRDLKKEIERVAERCGITHVLDRLLANLSKGYRQRVGLAQALLGSPAVLILDEPTSGLDPAQIREIRNTISSLAQEHTVILSTHILPEVTMICNRVIIINRGHLVEDKSIEELTGQNRAADQLEVRLSKTLESPEKILKDFKGILSFETKEEGRLLKLRLESKDEALLQSVVSGLMKKEIGLLEVQRIAPTLEDIFLRTISDDTSLQKETDNVTTEAAPAA